MLRIVQDGTPEAARELARLEARGESDFERVEPIVREILAAVRREGEARMSVALEIRSYRSSLA